MAYVIEADENGSLVVPAEAAGRVPPGAQFTVEPHGNVVILRRQRSVRSTNSAAGSPCLKRPLTWSTSGSIWSSLTNLKGKRIHAHLLAAMQANGVSHLLTFNAADFPTDTGLTIRSLDRLA